MIHNWLLVILFSKRSQLGILLDAELQLGRPYIPRERNSFIRNWLPWSPCSTFGYPRVSRTSPGVSTSPQDLPGRANRAQHKNRGARRSLCSARDFHAIRMQPLRLQSTRPPPPGRITWPSSAHVAWRGVTRRDVGRGGAWRGAAGAGPRARCAFQLVNGAPF